MPHTLSLKQDSTTLVDFQSPSTYATRTFSLRRGSGRWGAAVLVLDILGTSHNSLLDNVIALRRALELARENFELHARGLAYTPVFLNWKPVGATYTVQAECFGDVDSERAIENILGSPERIMANRLESILLNLVVRPYLEEQSAQSPALSSSTPDNNMTGVTFSGVRGDLEAPLKIVVRTDTANQTRVIVGIKTRGTVANFVARYEGESAALGSGVSVQAVAGFSGGQGARWSPAGSANEQNICTWTISANVADQIGTYRVFARVNDLNKKASLRVYAVSGGVSGDYGDNPKQVTTANVQTLVDCGVITLPPSDTSGGVPSSISIVLRASASAATTLDVDCIYLMPVNEGGFMIASFPTALGTGTAPDGIIDANDRAARAYLSTFANAEDMRGSALMVPPNRGAALFILTMRVSNGAHVITAVSSLTVTATPRYGLGRGS